jgi:hypothetical protein
MKTIKHPLVKLKRCEVVISQRFTGGSQRVLMARMVEWVTLEDSNEKEPVYGKCLLAPNRISDVETAKRIVRRYFEPLLTDAVEFIVDLPSGW